MTDKVFVDTNILVCARDSTQFRKQPLAANYLTKLWQQRAGRVSVQVLSEYYVTVTRKLPHRMDNDTAWDDVQALLAWNPQPLDTEVIMQARRVEGRFQTSWWDALIVAAAQAQQCTILLSEDFQAGMVFDQLVVRSPFASSVDEPTLSYAALQPRDRHRPRGRPQKSL